jgi:hypothetical protein
MMRYAVKQYNTVKRCIERYVADRPDWRHYMHGSTFFTSGYVDYLDDNYDPSKPPPDEAPAAFSAKNLGYRTIEDLIERGEMV